MEESARSNTESPPLIPASVEQFALTMHVRIKPGLVPGQDISRVDAVRAVLEAIKEELDQELASIPSPIAPTAPLPSEPYIRFRALTTTHYCRFVALPANPDQNAPPSVAFESNYDGTLSDHLDEMIDAGEKGLKAIYQHCEGWPGDSPSRSAIKQFLIDISIPFAAFYVGHRGLSQRWIQNDIQLWHAIWGIISAHQSDADWPTEPRAIWDRIKQDLAANHPEISTAYFERVMPSWKKELLPKLIPVAGVALLTWPVLLPVGFVSLLSMLAAIESKNLRDPVDARKAFFPITNLVDLEDKLLQNQLTHLVPVKPGWLRRFALKGVLGAINTLARYKYNKGDLGGIPSIHFARWAHIDKDQRLLFFSNYDGSWESYLGDFIERAGAGLTGVWSNTLGFPRTKFLTKQGAQHAEQFKQWTRAHQIPTQVWYAAYHDQSVTNVINNAEIRNGLEADLNDAEIEAWLEKL